MQSDRMDRDGLERLGGFANYSAEWLAQKTGASVRTARRWRQSGRAPSHILRTLQVLCDGKLEFIHEHWSGWVLYNGKLTSPEGFVFAPGEVRSIPLRHQQISALEVEVQRLQRAANPLSPEIARAKELFELVTAFLDERRPVAARRAPRRATPGLRRRAALPTEHRVSATPL